MPSLRILYDVDGWAFHHQARALQRHAPSDFTVSLAPLASAVEAPAAIGGEPVDMIFCLPRTKLAAVRAELERRRWGTRLVAGWSAGWPRVADELSRALALADAVIVNNRDYWERAGRPARSWMIPNGVDLDVFRVRVPIERRAPRVLWVGSTRFRTLKGYDDLVVPLARRLAQMAIPAELLLIDPNDPAKRGPSTMAEWYNRGTVLVVASESEGTPNPALEAAACGCTVVSTGVGNMPELIVDRVNGRLVERHLDALADGVVAACAEYVELARRMQRDIRAWDWRFRVPEFFGVFHDVLASAPTRAHAPV